ncbi:pyridoxal phosphate-dependent decarboxylase family protein [Microbacterium imperiale]|uniref:Glutamate decarboxylase n=1 Tax=Microbacterium imperiale TaxID=33884 RepID=A0A9W6M496_9MICO|nr:aminotransferase class V-fold PLP-dependent enzyme [Microbacterium imperiale]MBP2421277.1 glutamate/tyrosine decarboxylase-like PLP-dependent enzyme [Microbacterium imperiale]MDS0199613.1 aminotransferase class V-fold PLP-dependent enzyme [Microbacterium imperiale]BFE41616.1 aminotransferase class V-fold PLP-dependent enzyme [Microbacterium imperiale]GLJ80567.1 glutamate decarboxylase [Microbacterium imperiale]
MTERFPARMHDVTDETRAIVDLVLDYSRERLLAENNPLDKPLPPAELRRLTGRTIDERGIGARKAIGVFEHILAPSCISTDDPRYLSFIPSAPSKAAAAFDVVVSASALYGGSWLEGAGAVHAENEVLRWLADEFGLPASAGGVFVQGGTLGNLSALVAARETARERGIRPDRWRVVCSAEAHSSIASAARVMDVEVVAVPVADDGMLRGEAVRAALEEHGDSVFAVVATAGSTNFGIVDDVASVAAVTREHGVWLHVDGAYGLAAMLSPVARHRFAGVEHADSVIVDPHKWLFAPFDACALIYRDPELGRRAHTQHAEYLDTLTETGDWSPSDYAVHLTRRPRGLPLWFSLATYGTDVYRAAITDSIELAERIADEIERRPELTLVRRPQLGVVVFERVGWERSDYARWSSDLLERQHAFVTPSSHAGRTNARFAILNPRTTFEDLTGILDTMI